MAGGKKSRDKDGLDEKERVFVREYLIHQNAERAGLAAGYSKNTSHTIAFGWATKAEGPNSKPHIYKAIRKVLDAKLHKLDITSERILTALANIAFFNAADVLPNGVALNKIDLTDLTVEQASMLGEVMVDLRENKRRLKVRPWDATVRIRAIEMLAKYRNLLTPDAAVTVNVNANVKLADRVARAAARAAAKDPKP